MTPDELERLEKVAREAATVAPGRWDRDDTFCDDDRGDYRASEVVAWTPGKLGEAVRLVDTINSDNALIEEERDQDGCVRWDGHGRTICDHIATFDPPTALALLSELKAVREERDSLEDERDDYRERLRDLVMIDAEEWAIGGGPGFKDRKEKAWSRAREPFEP